MIQYKSKNEITQATNNIYRHINKDYNIRNKIGSGIGTNEMPQDLTDAIFYQETFRNCNWKKSDLTNVSGNGTIFSHNDFIMSKLDNVSLQYCSFFNDVFMQCHIHGSNFANSTFSNCAIVNGDVMGCSFVGTEFSNGILRDTLIESSTFERCVFKDMTLENLDLRQLTLNYTSFENVTMKKVCLPFIQMPYTFNGMQYIYNTTDDIYIASHEEDGKILTISEYMSLLPDFITFFDSQEQYFPLTNCYFVNNQLELAEQSNEIGIHTSAARRDFRSLYFYCIQATKILKLTHQKRASIYTKINNIIKSYSLSEAEYHQFCIYFPMIKKLIFDTPNDKPILMITLKTNIEPSSYSQLATLIAALEEATKPFETVLDSKHIEIRHNSPNVIDFFVSGNASLLFKSANSVLNIITPVVSNTADYISVGQTILGIGKFIYKRMTSKKENKNAVEEKNIVFSHETNCVRKELDSLRINKTKNLHIEFSQNLEYLSTPLKELTNLQEKLKSQGTMIHDIDIQYLNGEDDIMSIMYQLDDNTIV